MTTISACAVGSCRTALSLRPAQRVAPSLISTAPTSAPPGACWPLRACSIASRMKRISCSVAMPLGCLADSPFEAMACEHVGCVDNPAVRVHDRAGCHGRLVEAKGLLCKIYGHTGGVLRCGISRMGERDLHRTREAGTEIEREQIAKT